jgi:hypothetical protein
MDIISGSYEEIFGTMEITVNNWGTGGYKYSDGNLLSLGTPVALSTGSSNNLQKMFEGRITALAPKFPANEAPLLTFTVSGLKPQYPPSRNSQIELVLHQALLEFYPVLKQKERVDVIECTGVTVGTPNLRVYTLLTISGVGQRFSGVYSVTETIHRFDSSRGYTTRFTASKILRPLGRIP